MAKIIQVTYDCCDAEYRFPFSEDSINIQAQADVRHEDDHPVVKENSVEASTLS